MHYSCLNISDIFNTCSRLISYCNNNYVFENEWCNCITSNYTEYCITSKIAYIFAILIPCIFGLLLFAFLICIIYSLYFQKKINNDTNNSIIINNVKRIFNDYD